MLPVIAKKKAPPAGVSDGTSPPPRTASPSLDSAAAEIQSKRRELRMLDQMLATKKSELEVDLEVN